jgi:deoxyribonuclease-4
MNYNYGFHIDSTPKTLSNNILEYKTLINTKNPVIQLFVNIDKKHTDVYKEFSLELKKNNISVIVHASYTINIAQKWDEYSWWINQLILEIDIAHEIGARFIVLHLGKSLDIDLTVALNNMYSSLLYVGTKIKNIDIKILLETSSGQGSEMCIKLEDLAKFINKLLLHKNKNISEKFGICIDTCHIFSAGYDINTKQTVSEYIKKFDELIGIKNIKLFHLNNSKTKLGSNIDRHDNLEHGTIMLDGLKEIIKFAFKLDIPLILETPDEHINDDLYLLKLIYYKN